MKEVNNSTVDVSRFKCNVTYFTAREKSTVMNNDSHLSSPKIVCSVKFLLEVTLALSAKISNNLSKE